MIDSMQPLLRLAHSPDPDDAFMWWPLVGLGDDGPEVDTGRWSFELVTGDIESLNHQAEAGQWEITAISCAQYPRVADRYAFTSCGASLGDGYGPKLVTSSEQSLKSLMSDRPSILVPGDRTSALATLRMMCADFEFDWVVSDFETIGDRVAAGEADAGVLIHEGQLTYADQGLHLVADLGAWWEQGTGLPLPLGGNVIRRDLEDQWGPGTLQEITGILHRSVQWAMDNRERALTHAMTFGRGIDRECADEFVEMYVNRWTLDFEDRGRQAVRRFLADAARCGCLPPVEVVDFITAGPVQCDT
jgi:1,4-dihydroxy-6-naphthoate synthase